MDEELKEKFKEKQIGLIPRHELEARGDVGSGGYGSVCKAFHKVWKKDVAVKIMHIAEKLSEKDERKLLTEAEIMVKLRHEHLLYIHGAIIDTSCSEPVYGIVMPYLENGSVKSFYQLLEDRMTVPFCMKYRFLYEVIECLIYLHSHKVLHLDLKAANVLLTEELHVQICDFGLSTWNKMSMSGSQMPTSVGGTLTHFPPECLEDMHTKPSTKFDVYSYSIYMWEVLAGRKVYENVQNAPQLLAGVSSGQRPDLTLIPDDPSGTCEEIVIPLMKKCWSGDPKCRYTVPEIVDVLKPVYDQNKAEAQKVVPDLVRCLHEAQREMNSISMSCENKASCKLSPSQNSRNTHSATYHVKPPGVKSPQDKNLASKEMPSLTYSTSINIPEVKGRKSDSYVINVGGSSKPSTQAVERFIKPDKGMTTVNQIHISGGSRVHIGDIHMTPVVSQSQGMEMGEMEVNEDPKPENNDITVIDPKELVEDTHITQIAPKLGRYWKLMARKCFLFDDGDLDCLESDYSSLGLAEVSHQMLRKWKEKYGSKATRNWIATALIYVKKDKLVDEILNNTAMDSSCDKPL